MHATLIFLALLAQEGTPKLDPDAKARAQVILKEGTQLYQQGSFADALEKFENAYAVFPSPKLLFNIGQANRELGRPVEAMSAFERFQAEATDVSPELFSEARRSVDQLSRKTGKLIIDCDTPGSEIAIDGKGVGKAPLADPIRVMPGQHQVTATHPRSSPAIETVTVNAGEVGTAVIRLRPLGEYLAMPTAPDAAPDIDLHATPESRGWWLGRKWTWVAAGSTVIFAGVATTAGLMMKSKFDALRNSCGKAAGANWTGCSSDEVDSVSTRKNIANVFWGLTAAAAVTTGVLFYFEGHEVTVAPVAGSSTGFLANVRY